MKLIDTRNMTLDGKAHFYAVCGQIMRRILVDAARKRAAARHGGGLVRVELDDVLHLDLNKGNDQRLIALNDALDELARGDPRKAKVVELRYFAGLSVEDTAAHSKCQLRRSSATGASPGAGCWRKSRGRRGRKRRDGIDP